MAESNHILAAEVASLAGVEPTGSVQWLKRTHGLTDEEVVHINGKPFVPRSYYEKVAGTIPPPQVSTTGEQVSQKEPQTDRDDEDNTKIEFNSDVAELAGRPRLAAAENDRHRLRVPLTATPTVRWLISVAETLKAESLESRISGPVLVVEGQIRDVPETMDSIVSAIAAANTQSRDALEAQLEEWWNRQGHHANDDYSPATLSHEDDSGEAEAPAESQAQKNVPSSTPFDNLSASPFANRRASPFQNPRATPRNSSPDEATSTIRARPTEAAAQQNASSPTTRTARATKLLNWSLGLGITCIFFGGTFGILPIATSIISVIALREASGAKGQWKGWVGLGLACLFFISYLYNYEHIG